MPQIPPITITIPTTIANIDETLSNFFIFLINFIILFLDCIPEPSEKPDSQNSNYVPDHKPGKKCSEGEYILEPTGIHMKRVHHKSGTNIRERHHSEKADNVYNTCPRYSDFKKMFCVCHKII